jgi:hypothetical protein
MGLRFDHEAVARFYPNVWRAEWGEDAVALSMKVGHDSVVHMRRALEFVRTCDICDTEAVKSFTLDLARSVARSDLALIAEMKALRRRLEAALCTLEDGPGWPVWAAETRRLATSSGRELSSEMLPSPTAAMRGLK